MLGRVKAALRAPSLRFYLLLLFMMNPDQFWAHSGPLANGTTECKQMCWNELVKLGLAVPLNETPSLDNFGGVLWVMRNRWGHTPLAYPLDPLGPRIPMEDK